MRGCGIKNHTSVTAAPTPNRDAHAQGGSLASSSLGMARLGFCWETGEMTEQIPRHPRSDTVERAMKPPPGAARLVWVIDIGFFAILIACALRYYTVHPLSGAGLLVLPLTIGAAAAYLVGVLGTPTVVRGRVGVLGATAIWFPLVLIAPSFGWVAFALFFAAHRVLSPRLAAWLAAGIVAAVSVAMVVLSQGQDPGLIFGPLLGGVVLTVVFAQLDRLLEHRGKLLHELLETQQQLARSEREAGALSERTRVAGELHDTVVQQTAAALMLLESETPQSEPVCKARDVLRGALVETRNLMHGLVVPRQDEGSLTEVLANIASQYGATFSEHGVARPLSDASEHSLTRICQEALTNLRKHARADQADVTLVFDQDAVRLEISDNGIGFDVEETLHEQQRDASNDAGYGLRAMTWRAEDLGGTLRVHARPGAGTVVTAEIPNQSIQRGHA